MKKRWAASGLVAILKDHSFLRFLIAGGSTTALSYAIYLLLLQVLPYLLSYAISFVAGVVWSYFISTLFVFRRKPSVKRALAFPAVYLAQYLAGTLLLFVFVNHFNISKEFAPLIVIALSIPITYAMSRWIITVGNSS